jgi:hypothetical protein
MVLKIIEKKKIIFNNLWKKIEFYLKIFFIVLIFFINFKSIS